MTKSRRKVSLVTDIDALARQLAPPRPMWMVRPRLKRKYAYQRMTMIAEVVDLSTLDLAHMQTFETN